MRRNILNRILILAFLPFLFSCKSKKHLIQPVTVAPDPVPATAPLIDEQPAVSARTVILNNITAGQTKFSTLSVRAKTDLDIENKTNNVTMNIKIEKDKAIWISVTALVGLEVARVLITPDSIKIRDNINSNYIRKPFSYIYGYTNKQVSFNILQSLFVGNFFPELIDEKSEVIMPDKSASVTGILTDLIYSFIFDERFRVVRTNLEDEKAKQSLEVSYGDFGSFSSQTVPQSVTIRSGVANKNIGIDMKYSRVEIDQPVDMPFSVPARFKVKE